MLAIRLTVGRRTAASCCNALLSATGWTTNGTVTVAKRYDQLPLGLRPWPTIGFGQPAQLCRFSSTPTPSSSSTPSPPNLPDRQQLEKFFFRMVAFIWDFSLWLFYFAKRNVETHVIKNPSVQIYYKKLLDKMAESKKN